MGNEQLIQIRNKRVRRLMVGEGAVPDNTTLTGIMNLWREYEPWATDDEIRQTVSVKPGRVLDLVYDEKNNLSGFYVFRMFEFNGWKVMFRGNSYSGLAVRGIGSELFRMTMKEYSPDRVVSFTPQVRAFTFLSHFGELLPSPSAKPTPAELKLVSTLAGKNHTVDAETLVVKNFYRSTHDQQGARPKSRTINSMFELLGKRDAFALILRCNN